MKIGSRAKCRLSSMSTSPPEKKLSCALRTPGSLQAPGRPDSPGAPAERPAPTARQPRGAPPPPPPLAIEVLYHAVDRFALVLDGRAAVHALCSLARLDARRLEALAEPGQRPKRGTGQLESRLATSAEQALSQRALACGTMFEAFSVFQGMKYHESPFKKA